MNKENKSSIEKVVDEVLQSIPEDTKYNFCECIYCRVLFDNVAADIKTYINNEKNNEESLTDKQIEYAASCYVYDGPYDSNNSYWENIKYVIDLAREKKELKMTEKFAVQTFIKGIEETLTEEEKNIVFDEIYRSTWFDHVVRDIRSWLEDNNEYLTEDEIEYAASRYVYDGCYDCTLSYWDNIEGVINLAKDNKEENKNENVINEDNEVYNKDTKTIRLFTKKEEGDINNLEVFFRQLRGDGKFIDDINKIKFFNSSKKLKPKHLINSVFFVLAPRNKKHLEKNNFQPYIIGRVINLFGENGERKYEVTYTLLQDEKSVFESDDIDLFCNEMNNRKRIDGFKNYKLILFKKKKKNLHVDINAKEV